MYISSPIISVKFQKPDSDFKMEALRVALRTLTIPNTISMQYHGKSISFRSLIHKCYTSVKIDVDFYVYEDYMVLSEVKSKIYKFTKHDDAVKKTMELMNTWLLKEKMRKH